MDYQEITDKEGNKHIMVFNDDGSFKGFPADESNPEYIAFLAQLEEGNEPEQPEEPEVAPDTL